LFPTTLPREYRGLKTAAKPREVSSIIHSPWVLWKCFLFSPHFLRSKDSAAFMPPFGTEVLGRVHREKYAEGQGCATIFHIQGTLPSSPREQT
jgi:hypothetical protein